MISLNSNFFKYSARASNKKKLLESNSGFEDILKRRARPKGSKQMNKKV